MDLHNSTGGIKTIKATRTIADLGATCLDSDIIFGFTSHLAKRPPKFSEKIPEPCSDVQNPPSHEKSTRTSLLHSAEETQRCSRPPPEGSGSACISENCPSERSEDKSNLCKRCQVVANPTMQALDLTDPESEKAPTREAEQDWGVALGTPSADVTGPMQMVQGVALPPAATLGTSATVSFFARAAQKLSLSSKRKKSHSRSAPPTNFSTTLRRAPPPMPPCLLRARSKVKDNPGMGKVKVMVRVCPSHVSHDGPKSASFLKADPRKKQLTLSDPFRLGPDHARSSAPKTFTFDTVFTQDASQAEVCAGTVAEVLQSVVNGADGCVFCFGHVGLGKTYTMMGSDGSTQSLGVVPCAISWLYRLVEERQERTGARFSLGVSAVEISGRDETLRDLLGGVSGDGPRDGRTPALYLHEDPICGSQLRNQSELGAPSPEHAASLLDEALAARSSSRDSEEEERRHSHMLFTLHLYQQHLDHSQATLSGGRCRLHFIDLGSCDPITSEGHNRGGGHCLTLPILGNVILALTSGAKHVPYRDSKLTMLLRESLGNINCRTTMIAHVSDSATNYAETLNTIQLASHIHRTRKKKSKCSSSSSGGDTLWESQSQGLSDLKFSHPQALSLSLPSLRYGDRGCSSSRVQPRDTVVYVGLGGTAVCERELCVTEAPPTSVPIIPSLNRKRVQEGHPGDGDHIKCNTFAELQEWLDCVGDNEGGRGCPLAPGTGRGVAKLTERSQFPSRNPTLSYKLSNSHECLSSCMSPSHLASSASSESEKGHYKWPEQTPDSFGGMGVDRQKAFYSGAFNKSASLNRRHQSKPAHPITEQVMSQRLPLLTEDISTCRAPPVGMSQKAEPRRSPIPGTRSPSEAPSEMRPLRSTPRGRSFDRDALMTTVTLRRPVELNGEDELVFTRVEELSIGGLVENSMPSGMTRFHGDHRSSQTLPAGFHRVAIVSSINDEFDAYTSQVDVSGLRKGKVHTKGIGPESTLCADFPGMPREESSFKKDTRTLTTDGTTAASSKFLPSKYLPTLESTKTPSRDYKTRVNAVGTFPHPHVYSTLPRNIKPTSPIAQSNINYEQQKLKGKLDDPWLHFDRHFDPRAAEMDSPSRHSRNSTKRPVGNSNSVPRPPKQQGHCSPKRVVDGCERSNNSKGEASHRVPMLRREATTLGIMPVIHSSSFIKPNEDSILATGSLKFLSLRKKTSGLNGASSKPQCSSPPIQPVQRYNLDPKSRNNLSSRSTESKLSVLEVEFDMRFKGYSSGHKTSSLKADYTSAKPKSSQKARKQKGSTGHSHGSLTSLERCDSLTSMGSKLGLSRENSDASLGSRGRSGRSGAQQGSPGSASTSPPPSAPPRTSGKLEHMQGSTVTAAVAMNGNQAHSMFSGNSQPQCSTSICSVAPFTWNVNLPPNGKSTPFSAPEGNGKLGRDAAMSTKQVIRAANSRVSELASGSSVRHLGGSGDTERGRNLGDSDHLTTVPPSPYSKMTAPRMPSRYSSGHCSDNSSVLSGELPPAMGRTAIFYHSGGSSGYESMIRDSEATGSTSSAHDSLSESGASSLGRIRTPRSPKKRSNGYQRRRLIPAPLPDAPPSGRKAGAAGQRVDLLPLPGPLKEPFEIKVYEIDGAAHLQRQCPGGAAEQPFQDVKKGLAVLQCQAQDAGEAAAADPGPAGQAREAKGGTGGRQKQADAGPSKMDRRV
ncbi:kinesin-like protein KIF26A isoform X3 [Anguilla anguilla]|uniref:kinesin-like protein KIF26A isoform X3 n=1 Tax=Anguilla anguilla TaxID=7936 RepID=UPI0015AD2C51|nr:kinesin-like protein KIF26A isoform X3 [Anguilla anguilla]